MVKKSTRKSRAKSPALKKVCILTGGGDAPGLNAVTRAFTKTAVRHGIEVLGSREGFAGLIEREGLITLDPDSVRGILPVGGSILGCNNRANPLAYPKKNKQGKTEYVDVTKKLKRRIDKEGIDALVLVGGDGTMHIGREIMKLGVPVIGVPKTIDNDLAASDRTFGFDTAVATATWAIDALHSTAETHNRVMVLEVMGRTAGWIALHAGIAGGADAILIPEIPYDIKRVKKVIRDRAKRGAKFSIIVIGEGAFPKGKGQSQITEGTKGHLARLGGAGHLLAEQLEGGPNEVRVTVLGHIQRGGSPCAADRLLGTRFGMRAAELCVSGETGVVVALKGNDVTVVPLDERSVHTRQVEATSELVATARGMGIDLGG